MSKHNKKTKTKKEISDAIKIHKSMRASAISLGLDSRTFAKLAKEYDLYDGKTNRGGVRFDLNDILNGKHPQYPTSKLSKRLVKEGYFKYECKSCKISEWNGRSISLELNHIDGNNGNHSLANLELICPNCHSQTETYRSKKLTFLKKNMENMENRDAGR